MSSDRLVRFAKSFLARSLVVGLAALAAASAVHAQQLQMAAHGSGFVVLQPNPADAVNPFFFETGAYQFTQADGVSPIGASDLTMTYSVGGTINVMTGVISFSGGIVNVFADASFNFGTASSDPGIVFGADDGSRVGSFVVLSGNSTGNGQVRLSGTSAAGFVLPGYFRSASGQDLGAAADLQFSVDIGNAIDPAPSSVAVSELACKSGFAGPGCNGTPYANTPYYFMVTDGAEVIFSAVPEPSSTALALTGLAGLCLLRRRARGSLPGSR